MNTKCPNCGGKLEYDPVDDRMVCEACGSFFSTMEVVNFKENEPPHFKAVPKMEEVEEDFEVDAQTGRETMKCNIYTCTECGAQLIINDVEAATFCAYCGQPAIVFSRVSRTMKPDYIVPFNIRKERVHQILEENIGQKVPIFKNISKYTVEDVKGVYIPYWCADIYYHDDQVWEGSKGSGKSYHKVICEREAEVEFKGITLDASKYLNDEFSQRLEPFDLRPKKPFELGYLQGFYADCYDVEIQNAKEQLVQRATEIFNEEVKMTIEAGLPKIIENHPDYEVRKISYVLLPVWFVAIRFEGEIKVIMLNGQTGKVVGFLPYNKKKVALFTFGIAMVSMLFTYPFVNLIFDSVREGKNDYLVIITVFLGSAFAICAMVYMVNNFRKVFKSEKLSGEQEVYERVRDRQDKE